MSARKILNVAVVVLGVAMLIDTATLFAQTAPPKATRAQAPARQPAAAPKAAKPAAPNSAANAADAAKKAQIIASEPWRDAMFRINEWLGTQRVYTPQQVSKIKADFTARVNRMSADEVQFTLEDLNEKFQILNTKDAEDARAWLAHYLSILADKKRAEVINRIPNLLTMTAPQLQQLIGQIDERRASLEAQNAQVQQLRDGASNPWNQPYTAAQANYARDHAPGVGSYSSPYRSPVSNQLPFAGVKTSPNISFYSGGLGQFGVFFGN